ncbi:MAG TPA: hypothetical protein VHF92_02560 [Geodermatophilus sp.]|nr:hypothetical protein [Geodermatophilus sp.]
MPRSAEHTTANRTRRAALLLAASGGLLATTGLPAAAAPEGDDVIVLPGASSAEGIAEGHGDTFYAGDLFGGDIFRGDLGERTAELFIDAPDGRMAVGMFADLRHDLLFVAGGPLPGTPDAPAGRAYVYDLHTGETVAEYDLGEAGGSFVNDVTVTPEGAWLTDSRQPQLYFVPVGEDGEPGEAQTLELTGGAAELPADFNLNGIAATHDGETLVVAHAGTGLLYAVDPETGASTEITGVSVPNVDGIQLEGDDLYAVQNELNQVVRVRLDGNLTSGSVEETITDEDFQTPTTLIVADDVLAVVNAKFDTGIPPTAEQYEVVLVDR